MRWWESNDYVGSAYVYICKNAHASFKRTQTSKQKLRMCSKYVRIHPTTLAHVVSIQLYAFSSWMYSRDFPRLHSFHTSGDIWISDLFVKFITTTCVSYAHYRWNITHRCHVHDKCVLLFPRIRWCTAHLRAQSQQTCYIYNAYVCCISTHSSKYDTKSSCMSQRREFYIHVFAF